MEERIVELYRTRGAPVYARCRRLLGDDPVTLAATARVFVRVLDRLDDRAFVDATVREICAATRRLLLVPAEDEPTADELAAAAARFEREVYARSLPLVMRDQAPPRILRWVFIYAPIVVALAVVGMFLAVRNPRHPERFGGGTANATIEVYGDHDGLPYRLQTGMHVRHGQKLHVIVAPAGFRYATVLANARVVARLGPMTPDITRVPLQGDVTVEDEGTLRLSGHFGSSPMGLPAVEVAIEVGVD